MGAVFKSFHALLVAITFALAVLSALPGAVRADDAHALAHSARHSHHKAIAAAAALAARAAVQPVSDVALTSLDERASTTATSSSTRKKHRKHKHKHSKKTTTKKKKTTTKKRKVGKSRKAIAHLIPYGLKAGITGEDGLPALHKYIGSYSNWKPKRWSPKKPKRVAFFPMAWGAGHTSAHDGELLRTFKSLFGPSGSRRSKPPKVVLGFEEPDCPTGHGSSGVSVGLAAKVWNQLIGPLKSQGTILASPSMCKQTDEDWLTPFKKEIHVKWDVTNVHVNQDSIEGVKREIDYYWNKYKKPIYVTEFACVHTNPWNPSNDQNLINRYIREIVDYFESDHRVAVYQYSTGMGLADKWRLTKPGTKELTESGRVYRDAIKKYAYRKRRHSGLRRRGVPADEQHETAAEEDDVFVNDEDDDDDDEDDEEEDVGEADWDEEDEDDDDEDADDLDVTSTSNSTTV